MIVGCGHPSLSSLVERAQAVTGAPLYGIIGGLHFPVTGSRVGKGRQNIIGNGKLPWQRITRDEAKQAAGAMARLDLKLVALSAHDSCDWTLDMFEETLGERYRTVLVGEEIVVG
jgi:7,8-dihydropterin-6-yl-methyl-4-(beta-D-ribofuranosyl)aminobenzene 5'-phosphate synthase